MNKVMEPISDSEFPTERRPDLPNSQGEGE